MLRKESGRVNTKVITGTDLGKETNFNSEWRDLCRLVLFELLWKSELLVCVLKTKQFSSSCKKADVEPWPHSAPDSSWMCHAKPFLPWGLCTSHSFCPECLSPASRWLSSLHRSGICKFSLLRGFQGSPVMPPLSPLLFHHVEHACSSYCSSLFAQWLTLCLCLLEHEPSGVRNCDCIVPAATLGYCESSCRTWWINKIHFNYYYYYYFLIQGSWAFGVSLSPFIFSSSNLDHQILTCPWSSKGLINSGSFKELPNGPYKVFRQPQQWNANLILWNPKTSQKRWFRACSVQLVAGSDSVPVLSRPICSLFSLSVRNLLLTQTST